MVGRKSKHWSAEVYRVIAGLCLSLILLVAPAYSKSYGQYVSTPDHFSNGLISQNPFQIGVAQIQNNQFREAIASFSEAIASGVNLSAAYGNRCLAYLQLADYEKAIADCSKADSSESYLNRGLAYYRLERYLEAIADYDRVLDFTSQDFRAYYNRGLARFALGGYQQAIADYDLSIQVLMAISPLNSQLSDIYNERGLTYFYLKDIDTALRDYSQAIDVNPQDDRAWFNRGCAHQKQRNYTNAEKDFSASLQINVHNPEALINRAMARHYLGLEQAAIADIENAATEFLAQGKTDDYRNTMNMAQEMRDRDQYRTA